MMFRTASRASFRQASGISVCASRSQSILKYTLRISVRYVYLRNVMCCTNLIVIMCTIADRAGHWTGVARWSQRNSGNTGLQSG